MVKWFSRWLGVPAVEDTETLLAGIDRVGEQVGKLSRLSYKKFTEQQDQLERIESQTREWQAESHRARDRQMMALMALADDLDAIAPPDGGPWAPLFQKWRQVVRDVLTGAGWEEINPVGQSFDPRLAEALSTVSAAQAGVELVCPYQVIQVLRMGYRKDGQVVRKAQVLSVEGGPE